jgi:hypothetical protein
MYAYFGVGAVQISNPYGADHSYCLMYGDPGTMCGFAILRMNQMMTPWVPKAADRRSRPSSLNI